MLCYSDYSTFPFQHASNASKKVIFKGCMYVVSYIK